MQYTYKDKVFNTMTELASYLGLDISTVSKHFKRNGNFDTIGKLKNSEYKVGRIIGNKQIIAIKGKKAVIKCLNCGNVSTLTKPYIYAYCRKTDCSHCHIHKGSKYNNIEYKGVIYPTLTEFEKKTGYDRCTVIRHLKLYGNLDKLNQKRAFKHYKAGDIIHNVELIKFLKTNDKVRVKCLECGKTFTMHKINLYQSAKSKHRFRCKHCVKKNINYFQNKFIKPGREVKYKGKKYRSMHELARVLGVSPGKVIGQYHRHNGDLSRLRV